MIAYPQSIALQPQFWILNPQCSIPLPKISFIQPQLSIVNSSSSIHTKKKQIFDSKCPQNSIISDKMFASAACSFFQICEGTVWLLTVTAGWTFWWEKLRKCEHWLRFFLWAFKYFLAAMQQLYLCFILTGWLTDSMAHWQSQS